MFLTSKDEGQHSKFKGFLAPTGALIVMKVYYIYPQQQRPLFQIFTQSINVIDVIRFTLSRLNSINAIEVTRCWGYLWDNLGISWGHFWDILGYL